MSFDNTLSLALTESFSLESFEITAVRVIPSVSVCIDILIKASNTKIYNRTICIDGNGYKEWITDDFLYKYIQENIKEIFLE